MATPPRTEYTDPVNLFLPPVPKYSTPPPKPPPPIPREHYLIELEAAGPGPIMPVRIRMFLKRALRGYHLRCVKCYQLPKDGEGQR